jgi:haloacetate dehalogenase
MSRPFFEGFETKVVSVPECDVYLKLGGAGLPVLLLHGYPETHLAWRGVATRLAERFTVVVADLPGYGRSVVRTPATPYEGVSKRWMASVLAQAMSKLGLSRFAVAGHDRGGRVAYRLAIDEASHVSALAVLDVIPTLEMVERLTYASARRMANWFWLAQTSTLPESMIAALPDQYLRHLIKEWGGEHAVDRDAFEAYAECLRSPEIVKTMCEDYRAGDRIDIAHEQVDRVRGRHVTCPALILWSERGLAIQFGDPLAIWRPWAPRASGHSLPSGHFIMEEMPEQTASLLGAFLGDAMVVQ